MKRRTFIRLLVGLGIGIPVAIEGATFLGLLSDTFLGGGDGEETPTATEPPEGATQGDEILPETEATERLSTVSLTAGDRWTLTLTVAVENESTRDYVLKLGEVTTEDGATVAGNANTGTIPPGESGTVTEQWDLPPGSMPESLSVTAVVGTGAETETIHREVRLGPVSVTG